MSEQEKDQEEEFTLNEEEKNSLDELTSATEAEASELEIDDAPPPVIEEDNQSLKEEHHSPILKEEFLLLDSSYGIASYKSLLRNDDGLPENVTRNLKIKKTNYNSLTFYKKYMTREISHTLPLNGAQLECRLNKDAVFNRFSPINSAYYVQVMVNKSVYITCEVPKELVNLCINPITDPLSVHELGNKILGNLLEITFAGYLEGIERSLGTKIEFCFIDEFSNEGFTKIQYFLKHSRNNLSYPVNIYASEFFIKDFLDKIFLKSMPNKNLSVFVPLSIVSAIKQIPLKKIKAVRPGEIIILMTNRHLINQPLGIIGQRLVVGLNASENRVEVTSDPLMIDTIPELCMNYEETVNNEGGYTSSQQENTSIADNVAASMTDMRVPVTFELGRMDLPVNFLSQVSIGQVVDLNKPLDENISILVNGKVIALGEVVQVGHNFGVIVKEVI